MTPNLSRAEKLDAAILENIGWGASAYSLASVPMVRECAVKLHASVQARIYQSLRRLQAAGLIKYDHSTEQYKKKTHEPRPKKGAV